MSERRSPDVWLKIWCKIVKEKTEVSVLELSELSKASIWTIKGLKKELCEYEAYISFKNGKFVWFAPPLENTYSYTLSKNEKEKLR